MPENYNYLFTPKGGLMNNNYHHDISDSWHEMKHKIKDKWGDVLSNRDINKIKGKKVKLLDTLISKFDLTPHEAEEEIQEFWH